VQHSPPHSASRMVKWAIGMQRLQFPDNLKKLIGHQTLVAGSMDRRLRSPHRNTQTSNRRGGYAHTHMCACTNMHNTLGTNMAYVNSAPPKKFRAPPQGSGSASCAFSVPSGLPRSEYVPMCTGKCCWCPLFWGKGAFGSLPQILALRIYNMPTVSTISRPRLLGADSVYTLWTTIPMVQG